MPSRSGDQPVLLSGPWRGHNDDRVRLQDNEVEGSLNIEFVGGRIRRRPGRARIASFDNVRPTDYFQWDGALLYAESSAGGLADGNLGSMAVHLHQVNGALYFGFPFRVCGLNVTVGVVNAITGNIIIQVFSRAGGGVGAYRNVASVNDGTSVAGKTLAQSGRISWPVSEWYTASPWSVGYPLGAPFPDGQSIFSDDLYWIKITSSALLDPNLRLIKVQGSLLTAVGAANALDARCAVNSLTEYVSSSGSRSIVAQMDFPGPHHDGFASMPGESRFVTADLPGARLVPMRLPNSLKSAAPGFPASFAVFNGWLIGSTSEGKLFRFDGNNCAPLEALQGTDAARGILGARSYLTSAPAGRFLAVFRGKLMVAGDPAAPLTFYSSLDDADFSSIPPDAPVGGPNVWPLSGVATIPARAGDAIVGTSVIGDRYVVLTRREIWVYDDALIRQAEGDIGCVAPQSIQRIGDALMFLSHHGVFVFDGAAAREVSRPIRKILENLVRWTRIEEAVSGHDRSKNEYWLYLPILGRDRNRLAVVYNYAEESWRIVSGWYPWDDESRKSNSSQQLDVTSVTQAKSVDGQEILIAGDANGDFWQESVGLDDNGFAFPAYAILRSIGRGEEVLNWRTWRLGTLMDGAVYECYALRDGMLFEKEIVRRLNGLTPTDQYVQKRALSPTRNTWDNPGGWDTDLDPYNREDAIRFSFGGRGRRLQIAIVLPGGLWSGGAYTEKYAAPGGLREVQIDTDSTGGGR